MAVNPNQFVKVEVLKSHYYDGVTYHPGDTYTCPRTFFRALEGLGRVKRFTPPPPVEKKASARRRTPIRTAAMKSEPVLETPQDVSQTEETSQVTPESASESTRRYNRRDLQAEE